MVIYEDDNIYYGYIIFNESVREQVSNQIRNRSIYFANSQVGKVYKILHDKIDNYLVHAETEYVDKVVEPLLLDLRHKKYKKILFLGLGSGYLNNLIYSINPFVEMDIIEKYERFFPIADFIADGKVNLLQYDVTTDYEKMSNELGVYDIIIDDTYPSFYYKIPLIKNNLRQNGTYYFLSDYMNREFNTPYNYMKVDKKGQGYFFEKVDTAIKNSVIDHYKTNVLPDFFK